MKTTVSVEGLSQLSAAMKKLGIQVAGKDSRMVLRALHDGARPIVAEAKRLAPVLDESKVYTTTNAKGKKRTYKGTKNRRRGAIRSAITQHTSRELFNTVIVRVRTKGYIFGPGGNREAAKAGNPSYWWLVEFGTVKMKPMPFMRPAFDKMKFLAVQNIKNSLETGIQYYLANPANVGLDSQKLKRRR